MHCPTIIRALIATLAALALAGCIPSSGGGNNGNNGGGGNNGGLELDSGGGDAGSEDATTGEDGDWTVADAGEDAVQSDDSGGTPVSQGLQGYCEHYVDCGGTTYEDAEACVRASLDYWGECRQPELDAFGDCMLELTCEEWGNPDAFNPNSGPCADDWQALTEAGRCQ